MNYKKVEQTLDTGFVPDEKKYEKHLRDMVNCRTVSDEKYYSEDEFKKFDEVLKNNYPKIFESCEVIPLCGSTFLRIKGNESTSPLVLMSHKDVVPEGKKKWKAPPFEGRVIKGKMFGRGTFDCKGSLCALFEGVEGLLEDEYKFARDLYIFASSTEETAGDDAPQAVEYFKKNGIVPGLVIDEGGAVLKNPFPSPYKRFAMIGAVERSSARIIYDGEKEAVKKFSDEVNKLRPGKYDMYPEVSGLVHGLSEYLSFPLGSIVGFLDRHRSTAKFILTHCGADARSFCGALASARKPEEDEIERLEKEHGKLNNPVRANASGNFYNKIDTLADEIKKIAEKYSLKSINEYIRETEPPVSPDSAGYKFTYDVAARVFENIGVLPYPVLGRTDSRYFIGYAEDVIRFIPVEISLLQMTKFHCPNENIYVSSLSNAVGFYREVIKQYNS
ncbi:MAG: M20/M25/M40 family metallo-hydrolase [Clostridia bacterium]|nr:M20/M25/M40 family metallo-hydrolase [Clostridia bacterium]